MSVHWIALNNIIHYFVWPACSPPMNSMSLVLEQIFKMFYFKVLKIPNQDFIAQTLGSLRCQVRMSRTKTFEITQDSQPRFYRPDCMIIEVPNDASITCATHLALILSNFSPYNPLGGSGWWWWEVVVALVKIRKWARVPGPLSNSSLLSIRLSLLFSVLCANI